MKRPHALSVLPLAVIASLVVPQAHATPHSPAANFEGSTVPTRGDASAMFSNGEDATVEEFPSIIAGLRAGGSRPQGQSCTGSVIAPRKILIAAHCADAQGDKSFLYGLNDLNAGGGFRTNVVEYKKHPKYVNFDQGYDVAVVTVADDIPVPGGEYARFATSANAGLEAPGKNGLGFGYGKKDFDDVQKDVTLDKATLPIVDGDRQCQGVGAGFKSATMICAGYSDGRVTILPGDSGGPLVVDGTIIGVASWSRSDFKWYGVYGRLTNDMGDWVKEQLGTTSSIAVTPTSLAVDKGKHASATVTATAGPLELSAAGLPSGAKAVFQPNSVRPGSAAKLTIETAPSTPAGTYNVKINGTDGSGAVSSATLSLVVAGEVRVTASPSESVVPQGFFAQTSVTATGGSGNLTLSASGVPAGARVQFSPAVIEQGASTQMLVSTSFQTPAGSYPITVTATTTDGSAGSTTFTMTVRPLTSPN
ncbi:trypsin-like serine protease [Allokutzneria oryzae]|uniref:Trypsin-like serine protease n=1 Tax=Allokutzneria oryzae TaxID=1378989 RepID=A0ABV6AA09_9PSEU